VIDSKLIAQITQLVEQGSAVLATKRMPAPNHITDSWVDERAASEWYTRSLNFLARVLGQDSEHYKAMAKHATNPTKWTPANMAFGVLCAAKADLEAGAIFDLKSLVAAEVLGDLLDQAVALSQAGYHPPAAVVVGCVLEDMLRRLCHEKGIAVPAKAKLDTMNAALAKASVYNLLTQKKITALADIRNSAAHGKWTEFSDADVDGMIKWTSDFVERFSA
jgi:hypothetical protein